MNVIIYGFVGKSIFKESNKIVEDLAEEYHHMIIIFLFIQFVIIAYLMK